MSYTIICADCDHTGHAEHTTDAQQQSADHTRRTGHAVIAIDLHPASIDGIPRQGALPAIATTPVTPAQQGSLDDVDRSLDRTAVINAIRQAVAVHGCEISANEIRQYVPAHVHHKHIGQAVGHLARSGALEPIGWVPNRDVNGRNDSKLTRQWRYHPERAA